VLERSGSLSKSRSCASKENPLPCSADFRRLVA